MRLANKVAIVTGISSGIGRGIAYLFAKEGAKIVGTADKNIAGGEETVATIRKNGGTAEFVKSDVTMAADAENLAKSTYDKFGKIDILVNNAGIFIKESPLEDIEESAWDRVFAVNVKGMFLITKYAIPYMRKTGGGAIVNIASIAAVRPGPYTAAYASSKGAVVSLSKTLALQLVPDKIRVNYINPTLADTPMAKLFADETKNMIIKNFIPMQRMAKPEDVANAALYLASDESSMLTGAAIHVDGGQGI